MKDNDQTCKVPTHYLEKELFELIRKDSKIFDFIQAGALDGLWYWDLTSPENEWMDENFWRTLGQDPAKKNHLASEWKDLINPSDLDLAIFNFEKHCENPEHPYDQIVRYKHVDGSTVWVRCRGVAIRDENGVPYRMLGTHIDVTELKLAEERLKDTAQKKLIHMNDQLKLFAHSVSHDLKAPLRHIAQINKLIKSDLSEHITEKTQKHFDVVERAGERMNALISDIYELTTLSNHANELEEISLLTLVEGVKRTLFLELHKVNATLNFKGIPDAVRCYPALMSLVFQNLINNSIKYKSDECDPVIEISAEEYPDTWEFSISDNGIGVKSEYKDIIFKAFTRVNSDANIQGSGLGLSICKTAIEYHNGRIWVESNNNNGSVFKFTISKDPRQWDDIEIEKLF